MEQKQYEFVPVYMVCVSVNGKALFVADGLKDTTTDTEEAHCFLHESAAKRYIELYRAVDSEADIYIIRVHVDLDTVKNKPYHDGLEKQLLRVWEKIKKRVWK